MARGINKVIVLGNLGADPDARFMPNGNAVTNISVLPANHGLTKNLEIAKREPNGIGLLFLDD